jgi:ergothioneine biosynthesis protein EgtB
MPTLSTLLNSFNLVRTRTEELCAPLNIEDYVPQPSLFASPTKWHLAHTSWFFEEMILKKHLPHYREFNSDFNFLFNSYYNSIGERTARIDRGSITRPLVGEVFEYRGAINLAMEELLTSNPIQEVLNLVELGLQHEQQHQELLITDLKYTLSRNPLNPVYENNSNWLNQESTKTEWISIKEGIYSIGHSGEGFSFDNEHGKHRVFLEAFDISSELVTNGEFIDFIEDGGYEKFNFWLDEGWAWVQENHIKHPLYWHKVDGMWHQFTMAGLKTIRSNEILGHVSYYEAAAFALWKGLRLPTEFEWEVASSKFVWGKRWEWTNSAYLPYPGFKIPEGAVGEYNGKFMINQMVLRGSSVVTAEGHSRPTYRNFFHPQYQWQYTGIRLAK